MSETASAAVADAPVVENPGVENPGVERPVVERPRVDSDPQARRGAPRRQPRYHVILWDDDLHTPEYVCRMMRELFGHTREKGYAIAREVDTTGRAICLTTTKEHAELKRDQIRAFGPDRLSRRPGPGASMSASIEPEA